MTVKELKQALENYDDDMEVGYWHPRKDKAGEKYITVTMLSHKNVVDSKVHGWEGFEERCRGKRILGLS